MPPVNKICANCGAWCAPSDEEAAGTCRLNPPVVVNDEWCFPITGGHQWCSRWINNRGLKLAPKDGSDGTD